MSSKITFPIFKEQSDGTMILDKDIDVSTLTAEKDGGAHSTTFVNNGDGTYYFTITESGKYTVKLNGQTQQEFQDVYASAEDSLTENHLKTTATKGYIELDGSDELKVKDGETMLLESDIEDSLTSTSITEPLSANQGKVLKTAVDAKEAADATILKEADLNSSIATGGATKGVQAKALKDELDKSYANPSFISNNNSTAQNIDALDKAVAAVSAGSGANKYRMLFCENEVAANGSTDASALSTWTISSGNTLDLIRVSFTRKADESTLYIFLSMKEDVAGALYDIGYEKDGAVGNYEQDLSLSTSYVTKLQSFDISGFTVDTLYELCIYVQAKLQNISIQKPVILVK